MEHRVYEGKGRRRWVEHKVGGKGEEEMGGASGKGERGGLQENLTGGGKDGDVLTYQLGSFIIFGHKTVICATAWEEINTPCDWL